MSADATNEKRIELQVAQGVIAKLSKRKKLKAILCSCKRLIRETFEFSNYKDVRVVQK